MERENLEQYEEGYAMDSPEVQYVKPGNEVYKIRKSELIDPVRRVPLWLLIPLMILAVLGGYAMFTSLGKEEVGQVAYRVEGEVDYQVYLKENEYYTEKYLESGKQYIASLISTVRADFDYEWEADEEVDAHYSYEIIATAKATDRGDKSKVLYEQTNTLKHGEITQIEGNKFVLDDNVNIDYAKYSEMMRNFRSDFGIAANCFLDLRMVVKVDGEVKTEDTLAMNIPLSDQTVDISIDTKAINREEKVGEAKGELYVKDMAMLVIGSVIVVTSVAVGGILVYLYVTRFGNNWYAEAEHKIFKAYDTRIVNVDGSFYEPEDTVRVESFTELLDASDNEGAPIQYYNVVPDYKSYFVVKGLNTTYRYTLSREYQDKLRRTGQKKEF